MRSRYGGIAKRVRGLRPRSPLPEGPSSRGRADSLLGLPIESGARTSSLLETKNSNRRKVQFPIVRFHGLSSSCKQTTFGRARLTSDSRRSTITFCVEGRQSTMVKENHSAQACTGCPGPACLPASSEFQLSTAELEAQPRTLPRSQIGRGSLLALPHRLGREAKIAM